VEIEYKYPLKSRDEFFVTVNIQREGNARILFIQDIYRLPDSKLIAKSKVTGVATKKGKPVHPGNLIFKLGLEI
jgi:acyl-CoA thioesterase FadM